MEAAAAAAAGELLGRGLRRVSVRQSGGGTVVVDACSMEVGRESYSCQ